VTFWYEEAPGVVSAGRLAFLPAVYLGLLVVLVGVALAVFEAIKGRSVVAVAVIAAGTGLVSAAFAFKGWQKLSESKMNGGGG